MLQDRPAGMIFHILQTTSGGLKIVIPLFLIIILLWEIRELGKLVSTFCLVSRKQEKFHKLFHKIF